MRYIFDLDGTLCSQEEDYNNAKPLKRRIAKVNRLYDSGHTIIIDTARGSMTGKDWYSMTENQLKEWGVKYHTLRTGEKMYGDFYVDNRQISDTAFYWGQTKEEQLTTAAQWRTKNRDDYNKKRLQWAKDNRSKRKKQSRESYLNRKFDITIDDVEQMLQAQNNQCAICGTPYKKVIDKKGREKMNFHIDHDHKTEKVRGILCHNCNVGIGHLKDDINLLNNAIEYLSE